MKKIPISEIFYSLQGEGRNVGKPSIFVRFWGCNLHCTWCDTKYAWDPTVEKATILDLGDVVTQIRSLECRHIIFTGGEPSLYQSIMLDIQRELIENTIDGYEYTFELETNGSKQITKEGLFFHQINVSPKLAMSGNEYYPLEILKTDLTFFKHMDFKLVVSNMTDLVEAEECIQDYSRSIKEKKTSIYLMPLGRTTESQINKIVLDYCLKKRYNFAMRSHLLWFGDSKGV